MFAHFLEVIAPMFSAVFVYLGVRYSSKVNAKATNEGAEMQNELDWRRQFRAEIEVLTSRVEKLEEDNRNLGRRAGALGDYLDVVSMYLLYNPDTPFPDPPSDGVEDHYERSRWVMLKSKYESEERVRQERFQKQQ